MSKLPQRGCTEYLLEGVWKSHISVCYNLQGMSETMLFGLRELMSDMGTIPRVRFGYIKKNLHVLGPKRESRPMSQR